MATPTGKLATACPPLTPSVALDCTQIMAAGATCYDCMGLWGGHHQEQVSHCVPEQELMQGTTDGKYVSCACTQTDLRLKPVSCQNMTSGRQKRSSIAVEVKCSVEGASFFTWLGHLCNGDALLLSHEPQHWEDCKPSHHTGSTVQQTQQQTVSAKQKYNVFCMMSALLLIIHSEWTHIDRHVLVAVVVVVVVAAKHN